MEAPILWVYSVPKIKIRLHHIGTHRGLFQTIRSASKNMTTHSCDSKNSKTLPDAPATSLGISLLVLASKHQPLLTTSALANPNQPQHSSSTHSTCQHKEIQAPSRSQDHDKKTRSSPAFRFVTLRSPECKCVV